MAQGSPLLKRPSPRRACARRGFLFGGLTLAAGGIIATQWFNLTADITESALSVQDAYAAAIAGSITLIDIRRPDEWARTGIGIGAIHLDMRSPDFVAQLLRQVPDKNAPIALICARGVRSRGMAARLSQAGFATIIDVPEGMLGSGAGAGWLAAGLPVTHL